MRSSGVRNSLLLSNHVEPLRAKNVRMTALASLGGRACAAKMTPEERSARSLKGAAARWGFVVKDDKMSEETHRLLGKANERMPWPDPPDFIPQSCSPLLGFESGGSRGRWTQPKKNR